jgi:hypothetical protein
MSQFSKAYNIEGQMIIRDNETGKTSLSLMEDPNFKSAMEGLYNFVGEEDADLYMAYDWIVDQVEGCNSFVDDKWAWDCFNEVYGKVALEHVM